MANLTMKNWYIEDNTPYISLGSAGENNAKIINIEVDEIIDNANYYLDIGDENGVELPNTQQLATKTVSTLNGDIIHMLCLKPLVSFLGKEGIKLLQVRCVYTNNNDEEVVKESNVFHARVDGNSGFVYKYSISIFEQYINKIRQILKNAHLLVPNISATASVDDTIGTPSVEVVETGTTENPNFAFNFSGLKGEKGDKGDTGNEGKSAYEVAVDEGYTGTEEEWLASLKGDKGDTGDVGETPNISATASVTNTVGTPSVEVTKSGTDENPSFNFVFSGIKGEQGTQGEKGEQGNIGITPTISASATVSNTSGTPSVNVTKSGTTESPNFDFEFSGIKGEKGEDGESYDDTELREDITDIWKAQGELGAKNLIPYPYLMTTKTNNGVTITDNGDGTLTVNGTAQTAIFFNLCNIDFGEVPIGSENSEYIMSDDVDHSLNLEIGYNPRNKITSLNIWQGAILDNVTVYPMIRYKSDTDDTWTPYVPTNKEIKDITDIIDISNSFYTELAEGITIQEVAVYKQGKHIFGNFELTNLPTDNSTHTALILTFQPPKAVVGYYRGERTMKIQTSGALLLADVNVATARIHLDYVCK